MTTCFLCGTDLEPLDGGLFQHPEVETCLVRLADRFGIAVEDEPVSEPDEYAKPNEFFDELDLRVFPTIEESLIRVFTKYELTRLGGVSTGRGWSAFSCFQLCRYLFKRRYVEPLPGPMMVGATEPEPLAIGTMIHALLAVYYTRMIDQSYPLTPELLRDELLGIANPEHVQEGWRVFLAYALFYQDENILPLSVEHDLKDPRTGESCRFDLIAHFPEAQSDRLAGTWIVEHKSTSRMDQTSMSWANDGEVLGQVMLWKRLKLDLRFGELKGVIVNILGKQKEPKFHRVSVSPSTFQIGQHTSDLRRWEAEIQLANVTGQWPRSRANCINRYGLCSLYDHCSTVEEE